MADQPGVQFFVDPELIGRCSEDILQCALGDAFILLKLLVHLNCRHHACFRM
jgi:hypothetical protein